MNIQLNEFELIKYNNEDYTQANFINELGKDQNLVDNLELDSLNATNFNKMDLVNPNYYLVKLKENFIGVLIIDLYKNNTEAEIRYAIDKKYRGNNYASKVLVLISKYLFENVGNLKSIDLYIDSKNVYSINTALKSGYKEVGSSVYTRNR